MANSNFVCRSKTSGTSRAERDLIKNKGTRCVFQLDNLVIIVFPGPLKSPEQCQQIVHLQFHILRFVTAEGRCGQLTLGIL